MGPRQLTGARSRARSVASRCCTSAAWWLRRITPRCCEQWRHTRRDVPNLQLWIVGDGPLRANLQRLSDELGLSECVTFFGEQADIAPFLAAADLFVMSSISEGLPVALLEAMSAGLPAVVTDVGGMAEVARLSRAATLVPPSHPEALAQALSNAARQWQELPGMGQLARRCYETYFTPDGMNEQYLRLYSHRRGEQ